MSDNEKLEWAAPWYIGLRCQAVRERKRTDGPASYYGRCELKRDHAGDHALERGMDRPRWSTAWTAR